MEIMDRITTAIMPIAGLRLSITDMAMSAEDVAGRQVAVENLLFRRLKRRLSRSAQSVQLHTVRCAS